MEEEAESREEVKPNAVVKDADGDTVGGNDVAELGSVETLKFSFPENFPELMLPSFVKSDVLSENLMLREIMLIATTATAATTDGATALATPQAQLYPLPITNLCKLHSGNSQSNSSLLM
ncbi:hypothetical protein GQ457_10G001500 [Hibiscus cannabinus]